LLAKADEKALAVAQWELATREVAAQRAVVATRENGY
jgi:hypothetical protein